MGGNEKTKEALERVTNITFDELYNIAKKTLNPKKISKTSYAGSVAAAILSENGNVYTGVCIDTPGSMGFCAEHSAIAAMITAGESKVIKMIAVYQDETIIPPCGRCREFISQIHDDNGQCEVMVRKDTVVTINELLPHHRD